jgi:hypothetical protein
MNENCGHYIIMIIYEILKDYCHKQHEINVISLVFFSPYSICYFKLGHELLPSLFPNSLFSHPTMH